MTIKQEVEVKDSGELQEFHACYKRASILFFYGSSFRNTHITEVQPFIVTNGTQLVLALMAPL